MMVRGFRSAEMVSLPERFQKMAIASKEYRQYNKCCREEKQP